MKTDREISYNRPDVVVIEHVVNCGFCDPSGSSC